MRFPARGLYPIVDAARLGGRTPLSVCETLLSSGVKLVQYRDKEGAARDVYEVCCSLAPLARAARAALVVNDRADIARAAGAHGVHLGQEDLGVEGARRCLAPGQWIGQSTHSIAQVREADRSSADYIAFGPVFDTRSKQSPDPVVGLDGLREARRITRKPLVAIGGITAENAASVIEAGADLVSVIGTLLDAPDLAAQAQMLLRTVSGAG